MAIQSIITRIKNKVDSYSTWKDSTAPLLDGEIAIVRVPTGETYTNPVTGKTEPVVELLMKVGNGTSAFANLPWLSAKASDVYNWAKTEQATNIPVTVDGANSTLGSYLSKVNANAANITKNTSAITTLTGSNTTSGSVAYAIKQAIDALDNSDAAVANQFVTVVKQTDGKVTVTRRAIDIGDIPTLPASKIEVDSTNKTTLATKLGQIDASLADLNGKTNGHTDAEINSMIDNKINGLDSTVSGNGSYVTNVVQTNGVVTVTKGNLPAANASTQGIMTLGATGGAATHDAVESLASEVASLKTSVAGGVHFIGVVTNPSDLASSLSTQTVTAGGKSHTATSGDVVIQGNKEFIWDGTSWKELGDLSRVGALETKVNGLDFSDTTNSGTNKFVTNVTQTDGKIAVTFAQPSSANISHDSSTVKAALEGHAGKITAVEEKLDGVTKVTTSITNAINALDVNEPTASGTATSFIATASQTDGKITVTKKNLPEASTSAKGIVQLTSATDSDSETLAATAKALKAAYTLAENAKADAANKAPDTHGHGNITNSGTITSTDVKSATGVLVYDSNGKIQRAAAADARAIIGAGTSSLTIGTTATTAAAGNHSHSAHEARTAAIEANFVKVGTDNQLYRDTDIIIFDCGGAPV